MPSSELKRPVILCIDDAEVALRIRKFILASAGYDVVTADSGEAGLELFQHLEIDMVIIDHFLGGKTGTEIAAAMKSLRPSVPVLIFSAAAEVPDGLECVDEFLPKGEAPEVFLEAVARLLAR